MVRSKSLKPQRNPPKRKNGGSVPSDVHEEEMTDTKVKKKKKMEAEARVPVSLYFFYHNM